MGEGEMLEGEYHHQPLLVELLHHHHYPPSSPTHSRTHRECGCGSGDSGCSECGCCRVCAGEKDRWGGGLVFEEMPFGEEFERIRQIRDRLQSKREKRKLKSEKKEEKGEMGLQLLFGGERALDIVVYLQVVGQW